MSGLVINNNIMAMNAARNLSATYDQLAVSTQRLSSGLRINSAADDAAGLAVRENMRADIAVLNQGVRNAGDAISLIQTAEGGLGVIDEKLIRMKELAEQAATGTYTSSQRAIMDSEYQKMADEITRIANATDFNGVKLLDGNLSDGLTIHFGTGNSSAEDYYSITVTDSTATGLGLGSGGGTYSTMTAEMNETSKTDALGYDGYFAFHYDGNADGTDSVSEIAGFYQVTSGMDLEDIQDRINQGTAARMRVNVGSTVTKADKFKVGGVTYEFVASVNAAASANVAIMDANLSGTITAASAADLLVNAINANGGNVWAVASASVSTDFMLFAKAAGDDANNTIQVSGADLGVAVYTTAVSGATSGYLDAGGSAWVTADIYSYNTGGGSTRYNLRLTAADAGASYDLNIISGLTVVSGAGLTHFDDDYDKSTEWTTVAGGAATGVSGITTQANAQSALTMIAAAISTKEETRANLGAMQNRLENTITNLSVQAENLAAAESRVSDVDVATEMTAFTKNNILVQAAISMLSQANNLPQMALKLLG